MDKIIHTYRQRSLTQLQLTVDAVSCYLQLIVILTQHRVLNVFQTGIIACMSCSAHRNLLYLVNRTACFWSFKIDTMFAIHIVTSVRTSILQNTKLNAAGERSSASQKHSITIATKYGNQASRSWQTAGDTLVLDNSLIILLLIKAYAELSAVAGARASFQLEAHQVEILVAS